MLSRHDPFHDALSLRRAMDQLLEQSVVPNLMNVGTATTIAPMDICETENGYEVDVALPGVKPEDIELTVDQNSLTIRGRFGHQIEHQNQPQSQMTQQPQGQMTQQPQGQAIQQPEGQMAQPQRPLEGQTQAGRHPRGHNWLAKEIPSGSFERTVTFARPIDADKIETSYEYGILTIKVPVSEASRPKRISVNAGQQQQKTVEVGKQ